MKRLSKTDKTRLGKTKATPRHLTYGRRQVNLGNITEDELETFAKRPEAMVQCYRCGKVQTRLATGSPEMIGCNACGGLCELLTVDGKPV